MKNYIRQIILFSIGLILIVGIYIVDVVFYRVPSFIKVFRMEREIAALASIILIFPLLKVLYFKTIKTTQKKALSFFIISIFLLISLLLPHLLLEKYIVLWNNNPMLAEFPVIWNLYSVLNATLFALALMVFLHVIKTLVVIPEKISMKLGFNVVFFSIFIGAGLLNLVEDRYLYQPVLDGYLGLFNQYKFGIYSFLLIASVVSIRGNWIDDLNQREKIISFFGGLVASLLVLYLFGSKFIVGVYAYSTTIKGFVLLGYLFVFIFFVVSTIKILFHLPTAAKVDRVSLELNYLSRIESMVKADKNLPEIVEEVIHISKDITKAHGCWLELRAMDNTFKIDHSLNIDDDLVETIGSFTVDDLKKELVDKQNFILIDNIKDNSMTRNFRYLEIPWKSLLAVPVLQGKQTIAVLYVIKNKINGFSQQDEKTLSRFLSQIDKLLSERPKTSHSISDYEKIHLEKNNFLIDVIGSEKLKYSSLCEGKYFDCCIFGLAVESGGDKIAELRGSLKVLLQMNDNAEGIIAALKAMVKETDDYFFLFFNTKNKQLIIYKSFALACGLHEKNSFSCRISQPQEEIFSAELENWGIFKCRQETEIDLDQFANNYQNSKLGYLPEEELVGNFYLLFGEEQTCEDLVFIQKSVSAKN